MDLWIAKIPIRCTDSQILRAFFSKSTFQQWHPQWNCYISRTQCPISKLFAPKLSWENSHLGNSKKSIWSSETTGRFWCVETQIFSGVSKLGHKNMDVSVGSTTSLSRWDLARTSNNWRIRDDFSCSNLVIRSLLFDTSWNRKKWK